MLKETITYEDYNGVKRTEDHYFNLTEAEITEMELSVNGGFTEMIQRIVAAQDMPSLIKIMQDLILKSYGQKSLDGKRFVKVNENGRRLADEFKETEAYSQLFMKLATDADYAAIFVNGIVPAKLSERTKNALPPA
jgi:hypothetical protein